MGTVTFSREILPHVVAIAVGLCANPELASDGPDHIAAMSVEQVQAIYAQLGLPWIGLPGEDDEEIADVR